MHVRKSYINLTLVYCSILLKDKCTSCSIVRSSTLPWQSRPVLKTVLRLPKLVSCLQHGSFWGWINVMQDGWRMEVCAIQSATLAQTVALTSQGSVALGFLCHTTNMVYTAINLGKGSLRLSACWMWNKRYKSLLSNCMFGLFEELGWKEMEGQILLTVKPDIFSRSNWYSPSDWFE